MLLPKSHPNSNISDASTSMEWQDGATEKATIKPSSNMIKCEMYCKQHNKALLLTELTNYLQEYIGKKFYQS